MYDSFFLTITGLATLFSFFEKTSLDWGKIGGSKVLKRFEFLGMFVESHCFIFINKFFLFFSSLFLTFSKFLILSTDFDKYAGSVLNLISYLKVESLIAYFDLSDNRYLYCAKFICRIFFSSGFNKVRFLYFCKSSL